MARLFNDEQEKYFVSIYKGTDYRTIVEKMKSKFGLELTSMQVKSYLGNHKLSTGLNGQFPKGHIPYNAGKRFPGKINSGCFVKGNQPHNHNPVGTELMKADGYIWRKIAEPNKWHQSHRLLWEEYNGPIPSGCNVIFLDGNRECIELDNLALITKAEGARLNQNKLITSDRELTRSGVAVAKLMNVIGKRKRDKNAKG